MNSSGSKGFSWSSLMGGMANGGACRRFCLYLRWGIVKGIANLFTLARKSSGSNSLEASSRSVSLTEELSFGLGSGIDCFLLTGRSTSSQLDGESPLR